MLSAKPKTIGDSRQTTLFLQQNPCKKEMWGVGVGGEKKGEEREIYKLKTYEPITMFEFIWIMIQTIKTFLNYNFSNNWKCEH